MDIEKIKELLGGNELATALVRDLHTVIELWDDLIDKDTSISDSSISDAFLIALIGLPRNPFYQKHFAQLNSVLESAITNWRTANVFKTENDEDSVAQAYSMRCSFYDVYVMCAQIIGGNDAAIKMNLALRRSGDKWADYALRHGVK